MIRVTKIASNQMEKMKREKKKRKDYSNSDTTRRRTGRLESHDISKIKHVRKETHINTTNKNRPSCNVIKNKSENSYKNVDVPVNVKGKIPNNSNREKVPKGDNTSLLSSNKDMAFQGTIKNQRSTIARKEENTNEKGKKKR
ncbi:hypothetical protein MKS88_005030 [Plasmodium brasilianum]|uniref:Uncharacterized protein n=1 Tax=Plasmodium brasilianum TaxID=5824 RepID=A0ACB9Y540_PLABR|nr:hypothetical protein MKS88_005030 [Plasmodium brasilianum]